MDKKIDIKSTTIDKSLDIAKSFISKLISPSIEELGLLIQDQVSLWRFQNQIKILNKAQKICEKNNISTKTIPPKILSPFLENSSLEDNELLQDRWANLFVNMIDSKQNIQNHVFPYILSQLSKDEYTYLESIILGKKQQIKKLNIELLDLENNKKLEEEKLKRKLEIVTNEIEQSNSNFHSKEARELRMKKLKIENEIRTLNFKSFRIKKQINAPVIIDETELQDFEIANIIRLGLAKIDYETSADSPSIEIPSNSYNEDISVDFDIFIETEVTIIVTQLGELFVEACCDQYANNV